MKITHVVCTDNFAGVERHVALLAAAQHDLGHEVTVIGGQQERMRAAIDDARRLAEGHEVVLVSHQLPVWITRSSFEGRRYLHDPRKRECSLASVTSLRFDGDRYVGLSYTEPAADLLPGANKVAGA